MNILVDENIPIMTVKELRRMGHDVRDIRGTHQEGMTDSALWNLAQQEKRLLITTDKGFAQYRMQSHYGILIIQLRRPNRKKIHDRILTALRQFPEKTWAGMLLVMRDTAQSLWHAK